MMFSPPGEEKIVPLNRDREMGRVAKAGQCVDIPERWCLRRAQEWTIMQREKRWPRVDEVGLALVVVIYWSAGEVTVVKRER